MIIREAFFNTPARHAPRRRRGGVFLMAIACAIAATESRADFSEIDLVARFPVATVSGDVVSSGALPIDRNDLFVGGWYQVSQTQAGEPYRWMGPRAGAIDLSMVAPEEITLSVGLGAPRGNGVPPFTVRFYWNGAFIGGSKLTKPAQNIQATVPAELTRAGRNRFEIIPSFWVNASRLAGGASESNVSVSLFNFGIARRADAPARSRATTSPLASPEGIQQPANTVISYYEILPARGRMQVSGRWLDDSAPAEAVVTLTDVAGNTRELGKWTPGAVAKETIEWDLTDVAEEGVAFAEVSLIVRDTSASATKPHRFEWQALKLTAAESTAPPQTTHTPPAAKPNVILYVIDTLRASHLEPYGATNVRTPNFAALAKQGTTLTTAFSHASWTRPSVATLLTSLYETTHGTVNPQRKLAQGIPYLPELLRGAGYRSVGVSMNAHITELWGFARGFDAFSAIGPERDELLAPPEPGAYVGKLWDKYIAPGIAGDQKPFFLYLHEIDPHGPYTPPAPFDAMYPTPYRGAPEVEAANIALVRTRLTELEPQDIAYLEMRYRGEVSFVDAVLGALMERLKREGLAENTILIVVSDHGEEFGEHKGIGHTVTLYEEMLRVPLLWSWPGHIPAAQRIDAPVGLIDVAPTLLSLLGIEAPKTLQGRDLSATLMGAADPVPPRALFAYLSDGEGHTLQAAQVASWKLIERVWGPMSTFELFNLETDQREITNRWIGEAIVGGALRQALAWQQRTTSAVATTENLTIESIAPELVEQLRNLGYVQ